MEEIYNDEHIIVEKSYDEKSFRITLFDNYGHYLEDVTLNATQMCELQECMRDAEIDCDGGL